MSNIHFYCIDYSGLYDYARFSSLSLSCQPVRLISRGVCIALGEGQEEERCSASTGSTLLQGRGFAPECVKTTETQTKHLSLDPSSSEIMFG